MEAFDVINNLLSKQEEEAEQVKAKLLDDKQGRVLIGIRRNQYRHVELAIQYKRLQVSGVKDSSLFAGLLEGKKEAATT